MPSDEREFSCAIHDNVLHEKFSAKVTVRKKLPIRRPLQKGKIDLADIFITPISGQRSELIHHHFVVYDFGGAGLYIARDQSNQDDHRRPCSVWDLGASFAEQAVAALKDMA